jgi:hypothetical protein
MFKTIAHISTVLLMTSMAIGASKSQTAFAQSISTAASGLSTVTISTLGQPIMTQQASTSSVAPNGQVLTNTITKTTVLDSSGNPKTTITEQTAPSPLAPLAPLVLPTSTGITTVPSIAPPAIIVP